MEPRAKFTLKLPDIEDGESSEGEAHLQQTNDANQQAERQQSQLNDSAAGALPIQRKSPFKRSRSRLVRRNSYTKVPEGFFSVTRTMSVDFNLPNGEQVTLNCAGNHTVGQIKCELMVS